MILALAGRKRLSWIALGAALLLPASLAAHAFKRSFADLRVDDGGVTVVFDLDPDDFDTSLRSAFDPDGSGLVEPEELERLREPIARSMQAGLLVERGGAACKSELRGNRVATATTTLRVHLYYACPQGGQLTVLMPLLRHLRPGHAHFLTVREGGTLQSAVLTQEQPVWGEVSLASTLGTYTLAGIEHILIGYDHLLFLFALLVVARGLRDTLVVVTAFTVAHSVTLSMAAWGWIALPERWVESAIALTIAAVGALNLWRGEGQSRRVRWGLTFALGLVHGFGFAGVLGELGLPATQRAAAIFAFNAGVELGQVAIVVLLVPALLRLRRPPVPLVVLAAMAAAGIAAGVLLYRWEPLSAFGVWVLTAMLVLLTPKLGYHRVMLRAGNVAVVALGTLWLVVRAFGL